MKRLALALLLLSTVTAAQAPGDLNPGNQFDWTPYALTPQKPEWPLERIDQFMYELLVQRGSSYWNFQKPDAASSWIIHYGDVSVLSIFGALSSDCAKKVAEGFGDMDVCVRPAKDIKTVDIYVTDASGQRWHAVWEKVKP